MATLFDVDIRTISEHLRNIFLSGELHEDSVIRKFRNAAADGKSYMTKFCNLLRLNLMGVEKWLEEDAGPTLARYYRGKMVIGKGPEVTE